MMKSSPATLRVMTYNIRHARGMDDEVDVARIAAVINEAKADLVALQEVDRGVERTGRRDLPAELAQCTGMAALFEPNILFEGGDYGNAILTRWPILQNKNELLPAVGGGERKGAFQLVVDFAGTELLFVNTHLDHRSDDAERILGIDRIREIVSRYRDLPAIVCGDFNDLPQSRTHLKMKEQFLDSWEEVGRGEGFTFPSDHPARRIDYVWTSREGELTPQRARIQASHASDHLPLIVDFAFRR
jgi:endonuclease/exonuclease/phosphatase family metal-dependent hydrolase